MSTIEQRVDRLEEVIERLPTREDFGRLETKVDGLAAKVDGLAAKVDGLPTREDYNRLDKRLGELIEGTHAANTGAFT